jgi:uncharacterized protein (TIGR02271 family)
VLNDRELSSAIGSTAYDPAGDKIGTVEHFFVDDRTGAPTWVAVTTGLFGTRHSVVPAHDASFADGGLRVNVARDAVRSAPHVPDTGRLDPAVESDLRRHYGLESTGAEPPTQPIEPTAAPVAPPVPTGRHAAHDEPPGPVAVPDAQVAAAHQEPADGGMVRSEERLRVRTEQVAARRVRLVKYVVTEEVQVTVPLRREEVRIEELPLEGSPEPLGEEETLVAQGHAPAAGLPDEIVLHAERPVVSVEVVPVERVRLRIEEVAGQEHVSDRVQREQIIVDRS